MLDCYTVKENLALYLDDAIEEASEKAAMEAHLASCAACKNELESLQSLMAELGDLPKLDLPDGFHEDMMKSIRALPAENMAVEKRELISFPTVRRWTRACASAAAGVAAVVLGLGVFASFAKDLPTSKSNPQLASPVQEATKFAQINSAFVMIDPIDSGIFIPDTALSNEVTGSAKERNFDIEFFAEPGADAPIGDAAGETVKIIGSTFSEIDTSANTSAIVQCYSINITTENFDAAVKIIKQYTGVTLHSSIDTYDETSHYDAYRTGYFEKVVPAAQFDEAIKDFRALGIVEREDQSQYAVTYSMSDLSAQLLAKEVEYERLMALLVKTTDVSSMLAVDKRLQTVLNEMDRYRGALNGYEKDTANPVITIQLSEKRTERVQEIISESFGTSVSNAFISSINDITDTLENAVVSFSGAILPLLLFGIIATPVILIVKKSVKR